MAETANLAQLAFSFGFMPVLILITAINFSRMQQTFIDFLENTTFSCFAVFSRHDICPEKT